MIEEKLTTVFDTIIQKKDKIETAATVDLALTELLTAIRDLRECSNIESINIDLNKLNEYGGFLLNLADKFDFSKEEHKREIISNSLLPDGLATDITALENPEEINKKISPFLGNPGMLKIFEYKQIYVSPMVWLAFGGTFEEWLEKVFTRYGYFALFLKLTKVTSDYYDLLKEKNITISRETQLRLPNVLVYHSAKIIRYIDTIPLVLIYNKEVNCSIEEYRNKVTSLLNYGVSPDNDINSIVDVSDLIRDMFGVSDSMFQYVY